jgi:hypothetical protein
VPMRATKSNGQAAKGNVLRSLPYRDSGANLIAATQDLRYGASIEAWEGSKEQRSMPRIISKPEYLVPHAEPSEDELCRAVEELAGTIRSLRSLGEAVKTHRLLLRAKRKKQGGGVDGSP